ncbi:hypothetical protein KR038_006659, partial [Drosophila bunnanda]
ARMATLYEDPARGQPLLISGYSIGMQMVPEKVSFLDPVFLRHFLCLMIVLKGIFYAILCVRQLRLISKSQAPPIEMEGVMSQDEFKNSKLKEFHAVRLKIFNICADTVYSCLDLYLCILAAIWKLTVEWYHFAPDVWLNVVFMALFATYLVMRKLPSMFYEKMVLDPKYNVDPEERWPLVGMICGLAFFVVVVQVMFLKNQNIYIYNLRSPQVAVIPLTAVLMSLAKLKIWIFVVVIWLVAVVASLIIHAITGIFGVPCLGKSRALDTSQVNNHLWLVLQNFKYPGRVYVVQTFYLGRPTAWVMGPSCCLRLDIHDNLMLNRNIEAENLPSQHVGAGLNDIQLAAFVAHQLAHWRLWHLTKSFIMLHLLLLTYLVIFGFFYKWQTMYTAAGFTHIYPYVVGYWLVYKYLMTPIRAALIWVLYFFLRHFEYSADAFVWRRGYGGSMKSALLKLFADDRVFPYTDHAYLLWHHRRPSILQRIWNIQRLEKTQNNDIE